MTVEPTNKPTVLVVDDAPFNIDVIRHVLKGRYRVKAATSGRRALEVAAKAPAPDAILLDVMLPDMDGFQVCRCLKDGPPTRDIPVIFVTGVTADAGAAGAHGAVGFIKKPVDPGLLLAALAGAIGV